MIERPLTLAMEDCKVLLRTELATLEALHKLCAYGVTPPLKVLAYEIGQPHPQSVVRTLQRLRGAGLVEQVLGCWRPTQQGIDLVTSNTRQGGAA
jgi:hypothetical protein